MLLALSDPKYFVYTLLDKRILVWDGHAAFSVVPLFVTFPYKLHADVKHLLLSARIVEGERRIKQRQLNIFIHSEAVLPSEKD